MAPSRIELFKKSLKNYLDNLILDPDDIHYEEDGNNDCYIEKYELIKDKNPMRSNRQTFTLKVPFTDSPIKGIKMIHKKRGMNTNWLINYWTPSDIINHFNKYYSKYILKKNEKNLSFVIMEETYNDNYEVDENIDLKIEILYYENHIPYDHKETSSEKIERLEKILDKYIIEKIELEDDIEDLKLVNLKQVKKNKLLINKLNSKKRREANNYKQTQKVWRKFYSDLNKEETCPVCYETITPDTLIVPNCTHIICDTCVRKCDNCPICRDEYDFYIEYEKV
jgi:hypothetical protein